MTIVEPTRGSAGSSTLNYQRASRSQIVKLVFGVVLGLVIVLDLRATRMRGYRPIGSFVLIRVSVWGRNLFFR